MSLPRRQLLATSDVPQLPLPSQNELSDVPPLQPRMIAEVQGQPELSTSIKQVPQSQPASQLAHSIGCMYNIRGALTRKENENLIALAQHTGSTQVPKEAGDGPLEGAVTKVGTKEF